MNNTVTALNVPTAPGDLTDIHKWMPFTQYLRPYGRKALTYAPTPDGCGDKVAAIIANGFRFESEVLGTGIVSLTVTDGTRDVAIELSENDIRVLQALKRLVESAYKYATADRKDADDD